MNIRKLNKHSLVCLILIIYSHKDRDHNQPMWDILDAVISLIIRLQSSPASRRDYKHKQLTTKAVQYTNIKNTATKFTEARTINGETHSVQFTYSHGEWWVSEIAFLMATGLLTLDQHSSMMLEEGLDISIEDAKRLVKNSSKLSPTRKMIILSWMDNSIY